MKLKTIKEAREGAQPRVRPDVAAQAEAYLVATYGGDNLMGDVLAAILDRPECWARTSIACDHCEDMPLLECSVGAKRLVCPVCGANEEHVPGAGEGPLVAPARVGR